VCRGVGVEALIAPAPRGGGASVAARGATAGVGERGRAATGERGAVENPELFERLRALRKRLADAEGVPAYIVFSDAVLRQMVERLPRTRTELLLVSGVGPAKLERYGAAFLEVLREG
jgi:ATP-dependent DNA helicase RecQ